MGGLEALLLIGGIAGLYFWNLKRAAENLQYIPGRILNLALNAGSPQITVELIIQNTSNVDFTINSLAGNVTANGTLIGNVADFMPVIVPANNQGSLPLTLTLQPLGIVNQIIAILSGNNSGQVTFDVAGAVNANGIQQPFTLNYKVGM